MRRSFAIAPPAAAAAAAVQRIRYHQTVEAVAMTVTGVEVAVELWVMRWALGLSVAVGKAFATDRAGAVPCAVAPSD